MKINNFQKCRIADSISTHLENEYFGDKVAVLGFSFKKDTKDCRNSPAINLVQDLGERGASVTIYDPQVPEEQISNALGVSTDSKDIEICKTVYEACTGAAAVVLVTDWDEFGDIDWKWVASHMDEPKLVYDARSMLDHDELEAAGLWVEVVGRASSVYPPTWRQTW